MEDLKKYLEPRQNNLMDYSDFTEVISDGEEKILAKIKLFVNNYIKDILVINIKEDKLFLKEHELKKLPKFIQNMLRFSENRWIKIYAFNSKDNPELWKQSVWVFGWTMWRTNEYYFEQIICDTEISKIVKKFEINLSSILLEK